jgi:hypothetical protein
MIAAVNDATVNPVMIWATNQKNAPLMIMENSPNVRMFNGKVNNVTTGLTTIFRNTRQAATINAVRIGLPLVNVMPATKNGNANIASVVMNQRSNIMVTV